MNKDAILGISILGGIGALILLKGANAESGGSIFGGGGLLQPEGNYTAVNDTPGTPTYNISFPDFAGFDMSGATGGSSGGGSLDASGFDVQSATKKQAKANNISPSQVYGFTTSGGITIKDPKSGQPIGYTDPVKQQSVLGFPPTNNQQSGLPPDTTKKQKKFTDYAK